MDKIIIRDLRANAIIGTLEHERRRRQEVRATLELELDLALAGSSDDLEHSVNYAAVERRALEIISQSQYNLLEALGTALGRMILEYPPVQNASVRLVKPHALSGSEVEIVMNFARSGEHRDG